MRVLAADDDQTLLGVLERCLRSWGYEPLSAHDGVEAWRVLKHAEAPRIVILDWHMPGLTGLEVCRLLRAAPHGEETYVVMLTGRQDKDDLISALEAGADDFLSKPFHARELQLRLAKGVSFQANRANANGPRSSPPSGTIIGGKYRLEKQIAEGGMASVWLGVHLSLGINVAIKFMKPDVAETPDYASFEREARAAAALRTEHIVRIYDHGIARDGAPYLVMEYLSGESLCRRIERSGPLPAREAVAVIEQIGRALVEAHARNIIHGDVKPENILLGDDPERPYGIAKLVDFGLARSPVSLLKTEEGGLIPGTPSYMSPEHLRAQVPPNPQLDMWGLAATAFTALTGSIPFDGATTSEIVTNVCYGAVPVPSAFNRSLPPAIDEWFAKACAQDPRSRYATPTELVASLARACSEAAARPDPIPNIGRLYAQTERELPEPVEPS
jgi:serine/threonine protein kinase